MRWAGPVNRADSDMVIPTCLIFPYIFNLCSYKHRNNSSHSGELPTKPGSYEHTGKSNFAFDNLHYRLTFDLDNENEIHGKNLLRGS